MGNPRSDLAGGSSSSGSSSTSTSSYPAYLDVDATLFPAPFASALRSACRVAISSSSEAMSAGVEGAQRELELDLPELTVATTAAARKGRYELPP